MQGLKNWSAAQDAHGPVQCTGVLKWKKEGERLLQSSGLPWTIVRPNRLTDGPYTSYDLNTLLQVPVSRLLESGAGTCLPLCGEDPHGAMSE